jgi:hypothetical protein
MTAAMEMPTLRTFGNHTVTPPTPAYPRAAMIRPITPPTITGSPKTPKRLLMASGSASSLLAGITSIILFTSRRG